MSNAFSSVRFASQEAVNGKSNKNMNVNQPVNNTLPLQPNKEVSVEKSFKIDEEDSAKPKLTETRKVTPLFTSFMMVTDGQRSK